MSTLWARCRFLGLSLGAALFLGSCVTYNASLTKLQGPENQKTEFLGGNEVLVLDLANGVEVLLDRQGNPSYLGNKVLWWYAMQFTNKGTDSVVIDPEAMRLSYLGANPLPGNSGFVSYFQGRNSPEAKTAYAALGAQSTSAYHAAAFDSALRTGTPNNIGTQGNLAQATIIEQANRQEFQARSRDFLRKTTLRPGQQISGVVPFLWSWDPRGDATLAQKGLGSAILGQRNVPISGGRLLLDLGLPGSSDAIVEYSVGPGSVGRSDMKPMVFLNLGVVGIVLALVLSLAK